MASYENKTMSHFKIIVLDIVEQIENCIFSNEKIKINMVARKSGYHLRHIHNIFKKEVGVTIDKYIRLRCITRSALLVRFTNRIILIYHQNLILVHNSHLIEHLHLILVALHCSTEVENFLVYQNSTFLTLLIL